MSGHAQPGTDLLGGLVQVIGLGTVVHLLQVEVVEGVGRPDVHVQVRDLVPGDHQPGPLGAEGLHLHLADRLGDGDQVRDEFRIGLGPLVHLGAGHHEGVALGQGADGQERRAGLVLPDEAAGQFPVEDAGEDGAHGVDASIVVVRGWEFGVRSGAGGIRTDGRQGSSPVATGRPGVLDQADQEPGNSAARYPAMFSAATSWAAFTPEPQ